MPKKNKTGTKREGADDFDDMLADFRAADLADAHSGHVVQRAADDNPLNATRVQASGVTVPEATIFAAIIAGDLTRLRRWHRLGIRYTAHMFNMAVELGSIAVMQCLVEELGVDVNGAVARGTTALMMAARGGHLKVVKCLVSDLGADVNQTGDDGCSALMLASYTKRDGVIRFLLRNGADAQAFSSDGPSDGTAADASREGGAPVTQTEYLEAKAHCSNRDCSGAGLKKCTGCKQARYCGEACQLAHWKAHKADCKANKKA
jgi:hypothetical protein